MVYCFLVPQVHGSSQHQVPQKSQHGASGAKNKLSQETLLMASSMV